MRDNALYDQSKGCGGTAIFDKGTWDIPEVTTTTLAQVISDFKEQNPEITIIT
jgi:hypothetical protein